MTDFDNGEMIDRIAVAAGIPNESRTEQPEQPAPVDNVPDEEPRALNLNDLATRLEMDVADLYSTEVTITDEDGNPSPLPIGKLKDVYQESLKGKRYAEEAKREREELRERQQAFEHRIAEAEQRAAVTAAIMRDVEAAYTRDLHFIGDVPINWDVVREADPELWAAKQIEIRERQEHLRNMATQVRAQMDYARQQREMQEREIRSARLKDSQARLRHEIPEWRDPEVMKRDFRDMYEYLTEQGFADDELKAVTDHRSLSMARKAMLYDRLTGAGNLARLKVLKEPKKVLTGSARQSPSRGDDVAALKAKLRKSHHVDDAAALISLRLGR